MGPDSWRCCVPGTAGVGKRQGEASGEERLTTRQKSPHPPRHPELDSGSPRKRRCPPQKDPGSGSGMTYQAEIFVAITRESQEETFLSCRQEERALIARREVGQVSQAHNSGLLENHVNCILRSWDRLPDATSVLKEDFLVHDACAPLFSQRQQPKLLHF